jgi:hypothetical protein
VASVSKGCLAHSSQLLLLNLGYDNKYGMPRQSTAGGAAATVTGKVIGAAGAVDDGVAAGLSNG